MAAELDLDDVAEQSKNAAAWACLCDGSVCSVHLTKLAAMLIAENRMEQCRGRDFRFEVVPLYR